MLTRRTHRRTHRPAIVCALAGVLLMCTISGPATAVAAEPQSAAALAQEHYYSSYGVPQSAAALAQEHYYASYGEPEPLTLPQPPSPADGAPWPPIVLSIAVALVLAATATQLRRLRIRRRATRAAT
jgi:hypothetical protein